MGKLSITNIFKRLYTFHIVKMISFSFFIAESMARVIVLSAVFVVVALASEGKILFDHDCLMA